MILIKLPRRARGSLIGAPLPKEGLMNMMTVLVIAAMLATIASLVAGVSAMATDDEVGHLRSEHWMNARVGFQALALLLIVLALLS